VNKLALATALTALVALLVALDGARAATGVSDTLVRGRALAATPPTPSRILYASDWLGPTQILAVDPTGRQPVAQITFGRTKSCGSAYPIGCGFYEPVPSPDGRHIVYRTTGFSSDIWLADADGRRPRLIATRVQLPEPGSPYAAWSPDSRRAAYIASGRYDVIRADGTPTAGDAGALFARWNRRDLVGYTATVVSPDGRWVASAGDRGIQLTNRRTNETRLLVTERAFSPAWSPDSRSLAYVGGLLHSGTSWVQDLRVVTLNGKVRTVVRRDSPYGADIFSVAWTRVSARTRYPRPARVDGVFAGGEVARLAADGRRVAFAACNSVFTWTPGSGTPLLVDANRLGGELCFPPTDRHQVYDVAVSGDRIAFGRSYGGLTPPLEVSVAGPAGGAVTLGSAGTSVGAHIRGIGTLAAQDGLLVYSAWDGRPAETLTGEAIVTTQTIHRVDGSSCPCPAIASSSALETPLDVDGRRIVVNRALWPEGTWLSRTASLAVLDANGAELLVQPVDAGAAQLAGDDLLVTVRGRLLHYRVGSGALVQSFALPDASVARDCLFWSGPDCPPARGSLLVLQDAAHGLAAYTFDGRVHVLRLADGRNSVIGYGSEARFTDAGLVYADGARLRIVPFDDVGRRLAYLP
jgi:Tol biopolymer transport system component